MCFMSLLFISYAREDEKAALRLYSELKQAGHEPWLDVESILPGQNWKAAIRRAIRASTHFLALLSTNSVNKRGYVQSELRQALDILYDEIPESHIFLIPIRLDNCLPAHEKLHELNWVDLFPSWELGLEKILRGLKSPNNKVQSQSDKSGNVTVAKFHQFFTFGLTALFNDLEHEKSTTFEWNAVVYEALHQVVKLQRELPDKSYIKRCALPELEKIENKLSVWMLNNEFERWANRDSKEARRKALARMRWHRTRAEKEMRKYESMINDEVDLIYVIRLYSPFQSLASQMGGNLQNLAAFISKYDESLRR